MIASNIERPSLPMQVTLSWVNNRINSTKNFIRSNLIAKMTCDLSSNCLSNIHIAHFLNVSTIWTGFFPCRDNRVPFKFFDNANRIKVCWHQSKHRKMCHFYWWHFFYRVRLVLPRRVKQWKMNWCTEKMALIQFGFAHFIPHQSSSNQVDLLKIDFSSHSRFRHEADARKLFTNEY